MKQLSIPVLLVLIIFMNSSSATAQSSTWFGIKAGMSIPDLKAGSSNQNPLSDGYSSRIGLDAGLFVTFKINRWLAFQPEVIYSQQGGKNDGMQAIPNTISSEPAYLYANFNNTARLNYLQVPLMARFDIKLADNFNFYAAAGGFAGFLLSAKSVSKGNSNIFLDDESLQEAAPSAVTFDSKVDIKSSVNKFNMGAIAEIGLSFEFDFGKLFIEGGGSYGFKNIQKNQADGTNYAGSGTIHLGYMRPLVRKKPKAKI